MKIGVGDLPTFQTYVKVAFALYAHQFPDKLPIFVKPDRAIPARS